MEKCLTRSSELFKLIQSEQDDAILNSSTSQMSSPGGSSPLRRQSDHKTTNFRKTTTRDVASDLSQVRKQFEKASLAQIIARQKRQSETSGSLSVPTTPKANPPKFTINLQMISDLLMQRQDAISHLNSKLISLFDTANNSVDDDIWRKTLRISISNSCGDLMQPIGPIIALLSHPAHPISQISRDFALRLKQLTSKNQVSKQISEEYHQFSYQMINLLRHNYKEELFDDSLELSLQISIETFLFSHLPGLGTGITEAFSKAFEQEDAEFLMQITWLAWLNFDHEDALYTILNVPEKYRFLATKYDSAVAELRHASSLKCPTSKALGIVKVCDLICLIIEKEIGESSCIGSEDLVLLLSWVIVQAQIPKMITLFSLISEFLPQDLIRGQAGYILATMQTCLDYIKSIN